MAVKSEQSVLYRTFRNLASGTMSGIAVTLVGHPFDTLKVRLQTQPVHQPVYSGLIDCFRKTIKWEGLGGLYKGVGSPLVGQMFFRATMFTSYYQITETLSRSETRKLSTLEYYVAGGFTGFLVSFAESPIDLFKTKLQIQIIRAKTGGELQYRNVFHAGYVITKAHGLRGAYQGLHATWARNVPGFAAYFCIYETSKDWLTPPGKSRNDLSPLGFLAAGGMGGLAFWLCVYPMDVMKSTLQSDDSDPKKRRFKGYVQCAKHLYRKEGGVKRFFVGYSPCLMRSIPANAAQFMVLELCRRYFP